VNAADLKVISLLAELGDEDRDALAELLDEADVAAGRRLFSEGEESEGLVLLLEGRVRLELRSGEVLGHLDAGASLGGVSLVGFGKRGVTAFCEGMCRVARLERSGYRRLADDYPRTACRLVEALFKQLADDVREALDDQTI